MVVSSRAAPEAASAGRVSIVSLRRSVPSAHRAQRSAQGIEVSRPEDHAVSGGHIDEIEVDASLSGPAGQVGQYARTVLNIDHDNLAFAGDCEMRDRQRMPGGLRVWNEDVEFGSLA
jgi:hypothetical protein